MQWSKIPKSRLFLRYFGSYLIVFLVPVLFLFTIISIMYVRSIEEELTTINENMLQQVSEQVDEQITKITSVGNQINYSRSFSPYFIDDTNNYEKNVNELKLYNNSMAYADSMYIVINDQDLVISPDGIISIEGLLTNRTEFIVKEKEKMTDNIQSVEAGISVYNLDRIGDIHNDVKVVHYLMPLEGPQKNYGSIIFVLDMDYIESTLYTNADNNRIAVILDDEGNIVYTNGNIDEISEMGLSQVMINNLSDDISNFSHEGYVISQHSNELTDWTLLTLTETQQIYTPFIQALFVVFIFLLIFILIGVSLAIYFSNKNYEPLEQLTNIFSLENGDGQDVIKDEWSYIRKNIIEKQDETELLNARLSEQEHIIRENLLLNLLEGNPNIGNNELESQNIQFSNAFYSVLIIEFQEKLKGSQNVLNINNIAFEINEYTNKSVQIETTVPYKANNKIIAILNFEKDHQSLWDSILKKLNQYLNNLNTLSI